MTKPRSSTLTLSLILLLVPALTLVSGCKKYPPEDTATAPPPSQPVEAPPPIVEPSAPSAPPKTEPTTAQPSRLSASDLNAQMVLKPVYFEYDKYDLKEDARATLAANAQWMKANPTWKVLIEGHCDERGTPEYNMSLGDRRANAARNYLVSAGVDGGRLRTISYGNERPVDPGHTEQAWSKNRRDEFMIEE